MGGEGKVRASEKGPYLLRIILENFARTFCLWEGNSEIIIFCENIGKLLEDYFKDSLYNIGRDK